MSLRTASWTSPERGALFVVTGASGTGKTTLVHEALNVVPRLQFSVSATTRPQRENEVNGQDYHFLDRDTFQARVEAGEFLEWAEVYGNLYGTLRHPVHEALRQGASVLLDIDTQGAEQVRAGSPDAISVFVLPPSIEVLVARLTARATDAPDVIQRRIQEATIQLREAKHFDYLVVNDDLDSAHDQFQAILIAELLRVERHMSLARRFSD